MSQQNSAVSSFSLFKGIKFIFISYIISVALIAIVSALVVYTDVPEAICAPSVRVITFFGAFLSSFLTARNLTGQGWIAGAIVGALNICFIILLGAASYGTLIFTLPNLYMLIFGIISGMAGGIIGVNMSHK